MINYSAHDIKRYLNRQMNASEMHAFETAMMDDPMLADAVDGYQSVAGDLDWEKNLVEIKERLNPKKENGKLIAGFFRPWMRVAAGFIIVLGTAVVLIRFLNPAEPPKSIASSDVQQKELNAPALKETVVDSNSVAIHEQKAVKDNTIAVKPLQQPKPSKQSATSETADNDLAVVEKESMNNTTIATPPSGAPVAAAEKKEEAIATARMETKAKTKAPTLNKFTGVVVDENNNPLPFANITEVNSGVGTYADVKGNFTLIATDTILTIETKFVGYSNANVLLRTNQSQRITLKDEAVIAGAPTRDQLYKRNKSRVPTMTEEITEMDSEPADGWKNYSKYVMNNLRTEDLNEKLKFSEIQTAKEVELSFEVQPDGTIANVKVVRSTCNTCNEEAVRLIKEGPKWKSKTGKKETARFTVKF
jgi:hypothetical protein